MQPKTPKLLQDIRDAAEFIREQTDGKTLEDYRASRLLRQAIERNFEVIGEAMNRVARNDAETAARISHHPQIIAFRNILIHGYDMIDDEQVWKIITEQLPILECEVEELLSGTDQA